MKGFTLIEALITIAVASILAAVAIPSYQTMIIKNELSSIADEFTGALRLAQSEAISRGVRVSIVPHSRSGKQWKKGWDIFEDSANLGVKDSSEELIRTYSPRNSRPTLTTNSSIFKKYITFLPTGVPIGNAGFSGNFRVCPASAKTNIARTIYIERSGNTRNHKEAVQCP